MGAEKGEEGEIAGEAEKGDEAGEVDPPPSKAEGGDDIVDEKEMTAMGKHSANR